MVSLIDETFTETSDSIGDDFLARTVKLWEKEATKSRSYSKRVVLTRFGVILGEKEGALPMMVLPYKLFGGGKMGKGSQWLSWIHIHDVARAIVFCMNNQHIQGPVNFTAPNPVQMDKFGKRNWNYHAPASLVTCSSLHAKNIAR